MYDKNQRKINYVLLYFIINIIINYHYFIINIIINYHYFIINIIGL